MMKLKLASKILLSVGAGVMMMTTPAMAATTLSLQESIDLALKNNKTIAQAEDEAAMADWSLKEAKGQTGVNIAWQIAGSRTKNELMAGMKYNSYGNNLKASIPLYTGGKIANNIKIKKLGSEIGALQLADTKQNVVLQVTSGYYQVLASENSTVVAQDALKQIQDHLKVVKAMYDAGVVAKSDVLRTEVEVANAQQALVMAKNGAEVAKMNLDNLMGLPLKEDITLKDELNENKFPLTMAEVISTAKTNNLTLQQINKQVEQAKAAIGVAKSNYLPTVGAYAQYTIAGEKVFGKTAKDTREIGLQANWNIFDNNVTHAQVKQAQHAYNKALVAQKAAEDTIELSASKAYLAMEASEKNIKTTAVAVTKAKEDYKIAQLRYSAGVGTNLDVVDSRVALTNAENNHIKALYDFNVAKAQLVNIMGK